MHADEQRYPDPSRPYRGHEVETEAELAALLASGTPPAGWRLQGIDLTAVEGALLSREDLAGLVVLGGRVSPTLASHLLRHGAVVFPAAADAPVDPYRSRLYAPDELYAGIEDGYAGTPDARAYAWSSGAGAAGDAYVSVLRAIHDDSLSDALDEALDGRAVVGVMGGHVLTRGTPAYARAARLGWELARRGYVVATGGGPGAMEAANLGALVARHAPRPPGTTHPDGVLSAALDGLAEAPDFATDVTAWVRRGLAVRAQVVGAAPTDVATPSTVGVPTWFYGHEPPNVFAEAVAKFFSNAVREDGLLRRCRAGIIVLPGAAGTVQEVFQAVTPRYYGTGLEGPLILVGRRYWEHTVPVWSAVRALARDRAMSHLVHLVDEVEDAAGLLRR